MADELHEHDRGLHHDLQTMLGRRSLLRLMGGAGLLALVGCAGDDGSGASASSAPGSTGSTAASGSASGSSSSAAPSTGASAASTSTSAGAATSAPATTAAPASTTAAAPTPETCEVIPTETAGPFPGDGSNGANVLNQSGVVRRDIRTSLGSSTASVGVPLTITMRLLDSGDGCKPLAGAAVYLWHCDAVGLYSMYSSGAEDETFLRGVQESDANGYVTFQTVFPGCYDGRWPHAHFEVFGSVADALSSSAKRTTSQLAFPEAESAAVYATSTYRSSVAPFSRVSLSRDGIFRDGADRQLPTMTGSATAGYTATIDVTV